MIQVTVKRRIRTGFCRDRQAFRSARRDSDFSPIFLHRIGAETHYFTFDHHVETIAVRQRLCNLNVKMIFRHFQHFTHR
ncbi:hypothetical protein HR12_31710 [Microbacterium sp. SUBG005]|nr:hypothetical protein HR12_31710 [Microbacterium sp. SUBG005]